MVYDLLVSAYTLQSNRK